MNAVLVLLVSVLSLVAPAFKWQPLPGSQVAVLSCPCHHILYHGTRGPGKTESQLMAFRKHVGIGYGAFWRGVIFDREYKNLDDLVAKAKRLFAKDPLKPQFLASKGDYKWTWPTGEELLFRVVKKARDYEGYHGHEYPFIGWNELTKYATSELYDSMMSCNRSSFLSEENSPVNPDTGEIERLLPPIPLIVFSTTNPWGAGHHWVKSRFIDVADEGQIVRTSVEVFNPRTQQRETVTKTQVQVFGSYKENRYLSPEYIAELEGIKDPAKRRAWLLGDWNIAVGGALADLWNEAKVIIPRCKIPAGWKVDRTLDWGSTAPFSVGWWAEANGEELEFPDGSRWAPAVGSLLRIAEWYGCTEIGQNRGLKLSARAVADGIKEREKKLLAEGWIAEDVSPGPADNSIGNVNEADEDSIRQKMADLGVDWAESDKSKGSRVNGLQLIRDRLEAASTGDGPALYFMANCRSSRAILPNIPRSEDNPDDVDTDAEDHIVDEVRYRVLAGSSRSAAKLNFRFPS